MQQKHTLGHIQIYLVNVNWCNTTALIAQCTFCALEVDTMPKAEQPDLLIMPVLLLKPEWTKAVNKQCLIGQLSKEINF